MTAEISDHDKRVAQFRAQIPTIQEMSDIAYTEASGTTSRGVRNQMELVGNRAADLVIALGSLKLD